MANIIPEDIFKTAVDNLIENVRKNIDLDQLRSFFSEEHKLNEIENVEFYDGALSSKDNQPSVKLNYQVTLNVPIYLDMGGKFLPVDEKQDKSSQDDESSSEDFIEKAGTQASEELSSFNLVDPS